MHHSKTLAAAAALLLTAAVAAPAFAGSGCAARTSACAGASQASCAPAATCTSAKQAATCTTVQQAATRTCAMDARHCAEMLRATYQERGWMGLEMAGDDCCGRQSVTAVVPGSPAARAGFQPGDVLTSLNGISLIDPGSQATLRSFMHNRFRIGDRVHYTVLRDGQVVRLNAQLVRIPDAQLTHLIDLHLTHNHPAEDQAENVR